MWSSQAIRMRAEVAGASKRNSKDTPASARAAFIASFIAKNADDARNNGGSPTAWKTQFYHIHE